MESSGVFIKQIAKNKKVIPLYYKTGDIWHTNIKMPDLVIYNQGVDDTSVTEIALSGFASEMNVVVYRKVEEQFNELFTQINKLLNRIFNKPESKRNIATLNEIFGDVPITQDGFEESNHLRPNTMACLYLQELFYFQYTGIEKVDWVVCSVKISSQKGENIIDFPIQLTPYTCKGNYIFPLNGSVTVTGAPSDILEGHRFATSQEFAIDIVDIRRIDTGDSVSSSPPNSDKVEDYFIFERDILAIGDGTVVAVGNQWPNELVKNPLDYSQDRRREIYRNLIEEGVDLVGARFNYVMIDHHNGEFSLYAHMSENTITVIVGDDVKQGQVIGKVGNTGNSTEPHLHFQLMDSGDFHKANGLPIIFNNLPVDSPPLCNFKEANSLLYSDFLYFQIPEYELKVQ